MVWGRSELLARHWARKPVPVKSNVNQDSGEGPVTLASKPSGPVLTPCLHTVGSRPSVIANSRAGKARPSLHGPARSDVESLSATSSPLLDRTSSPPLLQLPKTVVLRLLPRILVHRFGVRYPSPPNPDKAHSLHRVSMARQAQGFQRKPTPCLAPVTTSSRTDSTVSALGTIPFPQAPCNGNQKPSPHQARLSSQVLADSPDSPIWRSIQGQF